MLIFLVINVVFPSKFEVLPCSSCHNGRTHATYRKKLNLDIDYEYENDLKNLTFARYTQAFFSNSD